MINCIFLLLLVTQAYALPVSLEVWFLSAHKKAELNQLMKEKPYTLRARTAALECQEMGDLCFDPQYGLYKKDDVNAVVDSEKSIQDKTPSIPSAKSLDRDLINCDPKNHFDMFCGKAKKEVEANTKLDLWIDTSSSMREMDFTDKTGGCFRKSMMTRLDATCGFNQKVNVMIFDTSIKQAGTIDSLCTNYGLNDTKKIIDWIERSNAKKLVILTDINEYNKEFSDYVESKHGKFRGDKDPLIASELLDLVDDLTKSCR